MSETPTSVPNSVALQGYAIIFFVGEGDNWTLSIRKENGVLSDTSSISMHSMIMEELAFEIVRWKKIPSFSLARFDDQAKAYLQGPVLNGIPHSVLKDVAKLVAEEFYGRLTMGTLAPVQQFSQCLVHDALTRAFALNAEIWKLKERFTT